MKIEDTKEEVRKLWTVCFEDSPEFIDLYFVRRYRDELNHTLSLDGRIVSALQIIPYEMTWAGRSWPMGYLSGVCTHPDYRGRGLMRSLLADTHRWMYASGCAVSTLIPAGQRLFDTYAHAGYAAVFDFEATVWQAPPFVDLTAFSLSVSEYREDTSGVYEYYRRYVRALPCVVQHNEEDFETILADLYLGNGRLWVARQDDRRVVGLAFAVPTAEGMKFNELCADTRQAQAILVATAFSHSQGRVVEALHPVRGEGTVYRLGMLRVINVDRVLRHYAATHPIVEACWQIHDEVIPENNACYTIYKGTCVRELSAQSVAESLSTADLALRLWQGEGAYMSLMLN